MHMCMCVFVGFGLFPLFGRVRACLSDCSLPPLVSTPQVIENTELDRCWTDCLFSVLQSVSGVNKDIFKEPFFSLLLCKTFKKCFLFDVTSVTFFCLEMSRNPRVTSIMRSTPPQSLQIAVNVMIIAANYSPVAPVVF